jgi:hypothetical protein
MVGYLSYTHSLGFMAIVLGLSIGTGAAQGQTLSFNQQFTTPGIDRATAVAADASGIYVAGVRRSPQGSLKPAYARELIGARPPERESHLGTPKILR